MSDDERDEQGGDASHRGNASHHDSTMDSRPPSHPRDEHEDYDEEEDEEDQVMDDDEEDVADQTMAGQTTLGLGDITTATELEHDDAGHPLPASSVTPAPTDGGAPIKAGSPSEQQVHRNRDDLNPGCGQMYSNAPDDRILRNTPIKRNDGDTFLRADLQHALLMEIFGDTTRCFRNPRPSPAGQRTVAPKPGESAPTGVHEYTPVYPYGQSKGSARRSNETPDEYQQWQERYQAYHDNPYPTEQQDPDNKVPRPGSPLLTFKELYIEALLNSPRCTKAVRDKVWQDEEFAENFACVNLLINIGRMNTTLAFYAQMQTVLRSYHPLPALQGNDNSRRHMQDAPRMKSLLKSVLLPFEKASSGPAAAPVSKTATAAAAISDHIVPDSEQIEMAVTLEDIVKRSTEGYQSPTSIVNFLFIISTQATELTAMHFAQPHDAHSIFFPHKDHPIPARDRAKAFLWLCWHYLEGGAVLPPGNDRAVQNPFADDLSHKAYLRARTKWDQLDDKGKRKATLGGRGVMWLGTRRSKDKDKERATSSSNVPVPPPIKQEDGGEEGTAGATATATAIADDGPSAPSGPSAASPTDEPWPIEEHDRYTHRVLCPAVRTVSLDEIKGENVDAEDELEWGTLQANDRREFMAKIAEEERQKMLDGTGEAVTSGKGKGKGKGKGTATKGKGKKRGVAGTELDGRKRKGKARAKVAADTPALATADPEEVDELQDTEMDPAAAAATTAPGAMYGTIGGPSGSGKSTSTSIVGGGGGGGVKRKAGDEPAPPVEKLDGRTLAGRAAKAKAAAEAAAAAAAAAATTGGRTIGGAASGGNTAKPKGKPKAAALPANAPILDAAADESIIASLTDSELESADLTSIIAKITQARTRKSLTGPLASLPLQRRLTIADLDLGTGYHATLASSGTDTDSSVLPRSLASLTWNRILQRALMGQGDAAYDSDDEDVAMDEAEQTGDVFKEELSRVVGCVWDEQRRMHSEGEQQQQGRLRYPWRVDEGRVEQRMVE